VKYWPLLWAGITRKRARAVLMVLQISSAFLLFGILQGLSSGIHAAVASTHNDRLITVSSVSEGDPLPLGLLSRIRAVPGIVSVSPRIGLEGIYQRSDQRLAVVAGDPDTFFTIFDEAIIDKGQLSALRNSRTAAIAGDALMKRYGWKVGQRIVLQSPDVRVDGSHDWPFDIVGTFSIKDQPEGSNAVFGNFDYINEGRFAGRDRVNMFVSKIADAANAGAISLAIDNAFANSDHETHTQSESDMVSARLQQTVDLDFIVRGIVGAVFFAILLSTGALMMQAFRERIPELAVLKTLGFTDRNILWLILAETMTLCVLSAAVGLGIAAMLLPLAQKQIGIAHVPYLVAVAGFAIALLLALVAGAAPAWRGSRLQVVEALAER